MSPSPSPKGRSRAASTARRLRRVHQGGGVEDDVGVVGGDVFGQRVRVGTVRSGPQLVGAEVLRLAGEVDGERADRAATLGGQALGGERGDDGGVEPAGEQGAQRDVGDELPGNDVVEQFAHVTDGGVQVVGVLVGLQAPVAVFADAAAPHPQHVAGTQLVHVLVDGVARRLGEGDEFGQPLGVDHGPHLGVREYRLRFGAEEHAVGGWTVVQRLDAHAVAHEQRLLGARVPQREGEHAVEPRGEVLAPLQVGMQDDLGVAAGAEGVTAALQFGAQLTVVVDLAAVGGGEQGAAVVRDGHGLPSALEVDDGQPPVSEGGVGVEPGTGGVRAAAAHGVGHRLDRAPVVGEVPVVGDPSGDSAHAWPPSPSSVDRPGRAGAHWCFRVFGVFPCRPPRGRRRSPYSD